MINPDQTWKKIWDLVNALLIIYTSVETPYRIAFVTENSFVKAEDVIIDLFFVADMILVFFTPYFDDKGNKIFSNSQISKNYLLSWFAIDLISVLPISYIVQTEEASINSILRIARLPKLYRVLKLTK